METFLALTFQGCRTKTFQLEWQSRALLALEPSLTSFSLSIAIIIYIISHLTAVYTNGNWFALRLQNSPYFGVFKYAPSSETKGLELLY